MSTKVVFNCALDGHSTKLINGGNWTLFTSETTHRLESAAKALRYVGSNVEMLVNLTKPNKTITNFPSIQMMLDGTGDLQFRDFALTPKRYKFVDFAHPTRVRINHK